MQAEFIQMKNANTKLMAEKKELNTVAQGIVDDKDKKIADLEDRLATIEKTEAEEIVDLENVITVIKKLVGIDDTKQLIQKLTNARDIIDEANQNGAELTFETLPQYIENYKQYEINQARLLESKDSNMFNNMGEESIKEKLLIRADLFRKHIVTPKGKFLKIPDLMKTDLSRIITTAKKALENKKKGQTMTEENRSNPLNYAELILQYYEAHYDKFVDHLNDYCQQESVNPNIELLRTMIALGTAIHDSMDLNTYDRKHLDEANFLLKLSEKRNRAKKPKRVARPKVKEGLQIKKPPMKPSKKPKRVARPDVQQAMPALRI